MKSLLLTTGTLLCALLAYTQGPLCLGNDTTVCIGQPVQISNCGGTTSNAAGITLMNPGSVTLSDDEWSGVVPIGFSFSFFGQSETQCVIGSNGLISFNLSNAGDYCPWTLTGEAPLPNSGLIACNESILLCYQDIYPPAGGGIYYETVGTAPNRMFVVLYQDINFFDCTTVCNYMGMILYETSNIIEYHIGNKPVCSTFNGGLSVQGVQNAPGTVAYTTNGRNNSVWSATQDGRRYTPASPINTNSYSVTSIPYRMISSPLGGLEWTSTGGQHYPYNNGVLNLSIIPPGITGYFLSNISCGVPVGSVSDTTFITRTSVTGSASATPDVCGGTGTATMNHNQGTAPYTYSWSPGGQTTQTATALVAGPYTVHVTDANGCSANFNTTVVNEAPVYSGDSTPVSCAGGSDGTATAFMTPAVGNLSYNWYDAGGQTTATAVGLPMGTYHCVVSSDIGCSDTVTVTVTEIPALTIQMLSKQDVSCNSGNDGQATVQSEGGTTPYSYSWDQSASVDSAAHDLVAGNHTITVTDMNGCTAQTVVAIAEPAPLAIAAINPDMIVCPENSATLAATGSGGSSAYTYTWTENGTVIGTGPEIDVDPEVSGNTYCVVLTEACGSPMADSCLVITFPAPITPSLTPDEHSKCEPGNFVFDNTSGNASEIGTMLVNFGDGSSEGLTGSAGTTHVYQHAGTYTMQLSVTSVYGCFYSALLPNIVQVIPKPTAEFGMTSNPATVFETTVGMQDKSSDGVVSWQWISEHSIPASSSEQNPVFEFPEGIVASYPIMLIVSTAEQCVDTVEHLLLINSDVLFYAPNSFTPNGDEFNNTFKFYVTGIDAYDFELLIYNRWGQVIWETHDATAEWDGTIGGMAIKEGAYTWIARVKDLYSDMRREFNGSITVLE